APGRGTRGVMPPASPDSAGRSSPRSADRAGGALTTSRPKLLAARLTPALSRAAKRRRPEWIVRPRDHELTYGASDVAYFARLGLAFPTDVLRATAARMSALNARASTSSPSWMSIARLTFPSRLELKSLAGSFNAAPLEKVNFT